jgi:hypothetical protein
MNITLGRKGILGKLAFSLLGQGQLLLTKLP